MTSEPEIHQIVRGHDTAAALRVTSELPSCCASDTCKWTGNLRPRRA